MLVAPPGIPSAPAPDLLQRFGLIRYDTALTGGRLGAQHVRRIFPQTRIVMEVRSIDAIAAMVSAGLGGVGATPHDGDLPRRAAATQAVEGRRRREALMVSCVRDLLRSPTRADR